MIKMEQQYLQELFNFRVALKQFNTVAGLFQIEPTEEGAKTLNSYGLYFKPQNDGFAVVAPCTPHPDSGLLEFKNQFGGGEKLSFAVFTKDRLFYDYSDLPEDPPGEYVYYLNNLNENERRTQVLLAYNKGIQVGERVKLHIKQFSSSIAVDDQNQIILPLVFDCRGNQIPALNYDLTIEQSQNIYTLDLSRLPDGLYTIQYNTESTTYYCAKASFIRRIPLLILEIFVAPGLAEKYRVTKLDNGVQYIDHKDFGIHFGNFLYYWQYTIIPVNINVWLKVATNDGQYIFTPENVRINNNNNPVIFTSTQAIDTPNNELNVNLYRLNWNDQCLFTSQKYQYCNQDYWILINNEYMCRYKDSNNNYIYQCPARSTDQLIGSLPKPGEVTTQYSIDADGNHYAQMTMYLVRDQSNNLVIKNKL